MNEKKYIQIAEDRIHIYTLQRQYTMSEEELMKRLDVDKDWIYTELARELGQQLYKNGDLTFTTDGNRIKCQLTALSGSPLATDATEFHLEKDYIYRVVNASMNERAVVGITPDGTLIEEPK